MATNFYGPVTIGTKVDVEAGATYIRTKVEAGGTYNEYSAHDEEIAKSEVEDAESHEDAEITEKLKSCFYGNEKEAACFLARIKSMNKDAEKTQLVAELVKQNKISEMSKGRDLYTILHENGLYKANESNWNNYLRLH